MQTLSDWYDIMSSIPLARAVPVVRQDGERWARSVALGPKWHGVHGGHGVIFPKAWRVDLDDPQGFSYALSWMLRKNLGSGVSVMQRLGYGRDGRNDVEMFDALVMRCMIHMETDADRVALATACAEVSDD